MVLPRKGWLEYRNPCGHRTMKKWKPIFIENSKIPVLLSKIAPIEIGAISLAGLVFSRGYMSPVTKRHETIHFQQQLEMLFIPFFLLYGFFWLKAMIKHRDGKAAYYVNPFEKEAYINECKENYLANRKRFAWKDYL